MTNIIQILDDKTANQIAAGEVIERPAAAVKELIENALDADARQIVIELEEGGRSLIRVTDDGLGMSQEDAILSLQRHATSKIQSADDLFRITTMGFRGEALPSIASVSQMTITTKERGDAAGGGTELSCLGGTIESVREIGARDGTSILVENLFYNVPARLKFLRTTQTEFGHILEWVQRIALARPDVGFRVLHQGQETWATAGSGSLLDACVQVFGRDVARHLVTIASSESGIAVSGFISTPEALKNSKAYQHTFINHRFIRNKAVQRALDDAYKSVQTLHGAKFPAAVIMIELDPSQVDVNVSPTKTEVRFTRENDIFHAVYHAVQEGLMGGGLVPTLTEKSAPSSHQPLDQFSRPSFLNVPARPPARTLSDSTEFRQAVAERGGLGPVTDDPFDDLIAAAPVKTHGQDYRGRELGSVQVLAQTRNQYILAQTEHALLLIDQHIAHERVLYERYKAAATNQNTEIVAQQLLMPFTLELDKKSALVVEQRLAELKNAGFDLEPFGGEAFVVRAVPALLAQKQIKAQDGPEATLREIIGEMVEKTLSRRLLLPQDEILISASCKMAVKAGDPLSFPEMETLIRDLLACENPYACPHGRPIIVELPHSEMDRKFGR